jgi:hypothetical protein
MYSYFSRHEVDKKGKDWDNSESPSNGKIMWLAWGGDAGFSWSRKIVEREKNMKKSMATNELVEEIKDILDDVVNPVETIIEIPDDELSEITKMDGQTDLKREQEEETYKSDQEDEDKWDNIKKACWEGYTQRGMKDKNGRQVPNCVPVQKAEDLSEADQMTSKSLWGSMFDPTFISPKK